MCVCVCVHSSKQIQTTMTYKITARLTQTWNVETVSVYSPDKFQVVPKTDGKKAPLRSVATPDERHLVKCCRSVDKKVVKREDRWRTVCVCVCDCDPSAATKWRPGLVETLVIKLYRRRGAVERSYRCSGPYNSIISPYLWSDRIIFFLRMRDRCSLFCRHALTSASPPARV